MDKLPSIFLNEYFKRKPMRLHEREDDRLFLMEKTEECNLEYVSKTEVLALEEKLKVAESCIKGALGRFDKGCHVLYLGDTYLKIKAYEEKYLEKIKAK